VSRSPIAHTRILGLDIVFSGRVRQYYLRIIIIFLDTKMSWSNSATTRDAEAVNQLGKILRVKKLAVNVINLFF